MIAAISAWNFIFSGSSYSTKIILHEMSVHNQTNLYCFYQPAENAFVPGFSSLSGSFRDELSLLCADGTQAPLSHYRSCNLGRGPGAATVTRRNFRKVSQKFLSTVQVPLYVCSSFTDSVLIPVIVSFFFLKHCPLLFRCSLEEKDRRCSASSSLSRLCLERKTFCSETRQTDCLFCQRTWTSVRWWGRIM